MVVIYVVVGEGESEVVDGRCWFVVPADPSSFIHADSVVCAALLETQLVGEVVPVQIILEQDRDHRGSRVVKVRWLVGIHGIAESD